MEDGPHPEQQLLGQEGLGEIVVGPDLQSLDAILRLAPGGEHQDGDTAGAADLPQDFKAIHSRHHHIQDDQRRLLLPPNLKGLLAGGGGHKIRVACPLEDGAQHLQKVPVIVHQQNLMFHTVRLPSVGFMIPPKQRPAYARGKISEKN